MQPQEWTEPVKILAGSRGKNATARRCSARTGSDLSSAGWRGFYASAAQSIAAATPPRASQCPTAPFSTTPTGTSPPRRLHRGAGRRAIGTLRVPSPKKPTSTTKAAILT